MWSVMVPMCRKKIVNIYFVCSIQKREPVGSLFCVVGTDAHIRPRVDVGIAPYENTFYRIKPPSTVRI